MSLAGLFIPLAKSPILRVEISAFLEAERVIRAARRARIENPEPSAETDAQAVAAIEAAIGQLVAARHAITTAAEAAPSKEL